VSRRGGKKRNECNKYGNWEYWQSAAINQRTYMYYVDVITKMALTRFRWINLPPTCDERYLEFTLVTQGMASIAFPRKMRGTFLSLQCAQQGQPNMYDRPNKWMAIGQNGTKYACSRQTGVVVFDNQTRYPLMNGIQLYANELTHLRITRRMNRLHQQIPFILKGPQEKQQDMVNMYKQVAGGEPAILMADDNQMIQYEALTTGVQFIGEELAVDEQNIWNRIYTMLGIPNTTMKQERQTEDEIKAQESPSELVLESSLMERRNAAHELNDRFGAYLKEPIEVIRRTDNESTNWNYTHNIKSIMEAGD
jgi:hypothetical protein